MAKKITYPNLDLVLAGPMEGDPISIDDVAPGAEPSGELDGPDAGDAGEEKELEEDHPLYELHSLVKELVDAMPGAEAPDEYIAEKLEASEMAVEAILYFLQTGKKIEEEEELAEGADVPEITDTGAED